MKTKRWRPSPQHAMWSAAVFALGAWSGARWAERGARASAWARPDAGLAVRADTTRCSPEVERDSAPTPRARAAAPDLPHTGRDLDALLSELGQPGGADAAWNELVARMRVDGRAREQVLQQFLDADDDEAETLSQLLCAGAPAETSRFALELAHRGGMSAARKALSLMAAQSGQDEDSRKFVLGVLATANAPALVSDAVRALHPRDVPPPERAAVAERLRALAAHDAEEVRCQSVGQLAQLLGPGGSELEVTRALADPASRVREAALEASIDGRLHSPDLKGALMRLATGDDEPSSVRMKALTALSDQALTSDEYALVQSLSAELE